MVIVRKCASGKGSIFGIGEKMRFSCELFSSTYSLKVKTILPPGKRVVESGGLACTSRGGRLSLGPPAGGMILAQPLTTRAPMTKEAIKRYATSLFMNLTTANLQT